MLPFLSICSDFLRAGLLDAVKLLYSFISLLLLHLSLWNFLNYFYWYASNSIEIFCFYLSALRGAFCWCRNSILTRPNGVFLCSGVVFSLWRQWGEKKQSSFVFFCNSLLVKMPSDIQVSDLSEQTKQQQSSLKGLEWYCWKPDKSVFLKI